MPAGKRETKNEKKEREEAAAKEASEAKADKTDAAAKASVPTDRLQAFFAASVAAHTEQTVDKKDEATATAAASSCAETQNAIDPPEMPPTEDLQQEAAVSTWPADLRLDSGVPETALAVIDIKCEKCEGPVQEDDFVWKDKEAGKKTCGKCNRLKSRIFRVLKGRTELKSNWSKMDPEIKKNFFLEQHELVGRDLLACLELAVTKTTINKTVTEFGSTGDWLDKVCVAV